ncbi:MAG: cohesin domain-containing protein [Pseudomonadota bacterium]
MVSWNAWKHRFCIALLLGAVSMQAAVAAPVLSMSATPNPAENGSTIELDVAIADIADLYAYQFTLSFNAALFQATGAGEAPFLATGGATVFDGGLVDNAAGTISYAYASLLGAASGVSGSGILAHFTFDVIGAGSGVFSLSDVVFLDSGFGDLAPQVEALTVEAQNKVPEPSALWLACIGLAGLGLLRRRQA